MDKVRQRGRRNILTGQVVSDKMDKTISVLIYNSVKHPKYKKYIKKTSVFKVHDEKNQAKQGDFVRIFETRALSKNKRWKLLNIEHAGAGDDKGLDLDVDLLKKTKTNLTEQTSSEDSKQIDNSEIKENLAKNEKQ